ncbi:hypothetical protein ACWF0M_31260 [Kribbella sp. NPDC055110]
MAVTASGVFRRTAIERADQRVSWERTDRAFFSSGACHVLAWTCRDFYPDQGIDLAALYLGDFEHPLHVYARWGTWVFDASGWNLESELLQVNSDFEGLPVREVETISSDLQEFCERHVHRQPHQYWADPTERARAYVSRHDPPWL